MVGDKQTESTALPTGPENEEDFSFSPMPFEGLEDFPSGEADIDYEAALDFETESAVVSDDFSIDVNFAPGIGVTTTETEDWVDEFGFPPAIEPPIVDETDFSFSGEDGGFNFSQPVEPETDELEFDTLEGLASVMPLDDTEDTDFSARFEFDEVADSNFSTDASSETSVSTSDVIDTAYTDEADFPSVDNTFSEFDGFESAEAPTVVGSTIPNEAEMPLASDVTSRPVPPLTSPPPVDNYAANAATGTLPVPPVGAESFSLPFAGTTAQDMFDFMGVADEPETIQYEVPEDAKLLTEEEHQRRLVLLEDQYIKEQFTRIYQDIATLYSRILEEDVSTNKAITDWAHNLLAETRYIIMNYDIQHLSKAEWNVEQVKARLERAKDSIRERKLWVWPIMAWGLIWFFIFIIHAFNPAPILPYFESETMSPLLNMEIFLRTVFFGGVGGVAAVFYNVIKYVSDRRYDREYNVSYFVKPFTGMIIGTLVFLVVFVVARFFQVQPGTGAASGENGSVTFEVITYFLAVAAGFKETLLFQLTSQVTGVLFRQEKEEDPTPSAEPPTGPFSSSPSS